MPQYLLDHKDKNISKDTVDLNNINKPIWLRNAYRILSSYLIFLLSLLIWSIGRKANLPLVILMEDVSGSISAFITCFFKIMYYEQSSKPPKTSSVLIPLLVSHFNGMKSKLISMTLNVPETDSSLRFWSSLLHLPCLWTTCPFPKTWTLGYFLGCFSPFHCSGTCSVVTVALLPS